MTSYAARGRIGGLVRASRYPREQLTREATRGFVAKFELEVDPNSELPVAERLRRADLARRAYMAQLALRSASVRARKRRARNLAAPRPAVEESTSPPDLRLEALP